MIVWVFPYGKLVSQLVRIYLGFPSRAINCHTTLMNSSTSSDNTTSKCTAGVVMKHVYIQPHCFDVDLPCLTKSGPNKSIPQNVVRKGLLDKVVR